MNAAREPEVGDVLMFGEMVALVISVVHTRQLRRVNVFWLHWHGSKPFGTYMGRREDWLEWTAL